MLCLLFLFAVFNYRNKMAYALIAQLFAETLLVFVCMLYLSKAGSYQFPLTKDYEIYRMFYGVRVPLIWITRTYNLCFALLMAVSVWQYHMIKPTKRIFQFLLLLPCIGFAVWTDQFTQIAVFAASESDLIFGKNALEIGNQFWELMFGVYMLLPLLRAGYVMLKSRIFFKKRSAVVISIYLLVVNSVLYYLFVHGSFSCIWFCNVTIAKTPLASPSVASYLFAAILIMIMCCLSGVLLVAYRPFNLFEFIGRDRESPRALYHSLSSVLHLYKNVFLMFGQQTFLIKENLSAGNYDKIGDITELSLKTVNKYTDYNNRLLKLLRGARGQFERINLKNCLENALSITGVSEKAEVIRLYERSDLCINGIEECITETFVNLIHNAMEACEGLERHPMLECSIISEDDLCMVSFRDNATGIPPEVLKHITEPFYSTKKANMVRGLGLSYVHTIVKQHHGNMRITSRLGESTNVALVFPVAYFE
ncbi:MAG: HAMP domain-containing histidine kinase [Ruminococcaceae bacterium]|nr:HAMP domain-containing histidine kinase [Oscillospiraceae bacterium]